MQLKSSDFVEGNSDKVQMSTQCALRISLRTTSNQVPRLHACYQLGPTGVLEAHHHYLIQILAKGIQFSHSEFMWAFVIKELKGMLTSKCALSECTSGDAHTLWGLKPASSIRHGHTQRSWSTAVCRVKYGEKTQRGPRALECQVNPKAVWVQWDTRYPFNRSWCVFTDLTVWPVTSADWLLITRDGIWISHVQVSIPV